MKRFLQSLNDKVLYYAEHPYMLSVFGFLGFLSGSFLPLPVDPVFVAIALRRPDRIWLLTIVGALSVTLGGLLMYGIGYSLYCTLGLWLINTYHWHAQFDFLKENLALYGSWIIIIKAFTPIPYKLLALVAGIGHLNLFVFLVASFVGRFVRFAMEGVVLSFFGPRLRLFLERYLSLGLGLILLAFLVLTFLTFFFFKITPR
ncbi:DedA family protein [bacterium NHP-B]|nr:DedA family protein [bacterium NHP-B]